MTETARACQEFRDYEALVGFLTRQEAAGALTLDDVWRHLAVDGQLWMVYRLGRLGTEPRVTPLRARQAVAGMRLLLDKRSPELAREVEHLGGLTRAQLRRGAVDYITTIEFLDAERAARRLAPADFSSLAGVDPDLSAEYAQMCRGDAGVIDPARGAVVVDTIAGQLARSHSALAVKLRAALPGGNNRGL